MRAILLLLSAILLLSACTQQKQIIHTDAWVPVQVALSGPESRSSHLATVIQDTDLLISQQLHTSFEEVSDEKKYRAPEKPVQAIKVFSEQVKLKPETYNQLTISKASQSIKPDKKSKLDGGCCTITLIVVALIVLFIVLFGNVGPIFTIAAGAVLFALLFLLLWNGVNNKKKKEEEKEAALYQPK